MTTVLSILQLMQIWVTSLGVGSIGAVYGYMVFYTFKRHNTPLVDKPMPIAQAAGLLLALGAAGALGRAYLTIDNVNYLGPYGIGLFLGVATNVLLTMRKEGDLESKRFHKG